MAATSSDPRPAVLFGAGASASAPASLPTAWGLIRAYCDRLESALSAVPDLAARIPPLEDWIRGLRFEQVVSTFNRMGLALDAIAPLDSSRTPNENHRLLASLYCAGWPLLTTNFDVLTEIAILEAGGDLHQIVDRDKRDGGEPSLRKLHGSFWRWRSGSWLPSADSICTTFEDIGEQYSRYMTNDVQRMGLVELIREQPLIVVGYSAGDDFDISPIVLDTPRDQPLIWIQHAVDEPESTWVTATSLEEIPAGARHLVPLNLFRAGHRHSVTWILCDTTAYLRTLVTELATIAPQRATAPLPPRPVTEPALPRSVFEAEPQACRFAGMLLIELGQPLDALACLEHARDGYLAMNDATGATFAQYEIARAYRAARDDECARTSLEATCRLARHSRTIRIEAASLHFLGRLVGTRNLIEAEDCFRRALALLDRDTDPGHYGSVLGDLGDIRWRRGARSAAYEMLVEAATLVEAAGALDELAGLQHRLAMWSTEARRLDEARAYTRAAIELREKLGDPEHALELIHELGIIEQYAGRIDDATRYFEEVAHRAADAGAVERRALAQYHLGWLAYQQGDIERATTLEHDSSGALEELGAYYFLAHNLMLRAVLLLYRGDVALGRRTLETAVVMSEQMDDAVNVQNCQALVRQIEAADPPEGVPFVVAAM